VLSSLSFEHIHNVLEGHPTIWPPGHGNLCYQQNCFGKCIQFVLNIQYFIFGNSKKFFKGDCDRFPSVQVALSSSSSSECVDDAFLSKNNADEFSSALVPSNPSNLQRRIKIDPRLRYGGQGCANRSFLYFGAAHPRCPGRSRACRDWSSPLCRVRRPTVYSIHQNLASKSNNWHHSDGIARVHGMNNVQAEELVE
jgi:hypothetical protein